MSAAASALSSAVAITVRVLYTFPRLVSEVTEGEVEVADVKQEWIEEAMDEIDRQAGSIFRAVEFTDKLNGDGMDSIFTRRFPLLGVSEVLIDGMVVAPVGYTVNLRTGKIELRNGEFDAGSQNITVKGTAGYLKVPALIRKIATLLVAKTALAAKTGPLVDSENIGDFSQTRTFKKLNDELDRAWEAWGKRFPIDFA